MDAPRTWYLKSTDIRNAIMAAISKRPQTEASIVAGIPELEKLHPEFAAAHLRRLLNDGAIERDGNVYRIKKYRKQTPTDIVKQSVVLPVVEQRTVVAERHVQVPEPKPERMPVEYVTAVRALAECVSIDEAKHWSDKAEALAAWAKIYQSDEAGIKARQLRLHAYRRMGVLAGELSPTKHRTEGRGRAPGPPQFLVTKGLSPHQAQAARQLALCPPEKFEEIINRPLPPSPTANIYNHTHRKPEWASAMQRMQALCSTAKIQNLGTLVTSIQPHELEKAAELALTLAEWLADFRHRVACRIAAEPRK
jgi:hypothetical protein